MVEFGLKLEDNKVAEWSEHYIAYEKLKKILKKCAAARQRVADWTTKNPTEAAAVKEAYDNGHPTPETSSNSLSRPSSSGSLNRMAPMTPDAPELTSELTRLFQQPDGAAYGSEREKESPTSAAVGDPNAIQRAISGVSDYFYRSYAKRLRQAYNEATKTSLEFETDFYQEIDRVNKFYESQTKELEARLSVLKESVAISRGKQLEGIPDESETSLIVKRKKTAALSINRHTVASLADAIRRRLQDGATSEEESGKHQRTRSNSKVKLLSLTEMDDEEADPDGDEKATAENASRVKEAQSIQRALIDQYRTAKLLQNYTIMNYTGFVKIIKKHDKTVKDEKGKYKSAVKTENICGEGKAVEELIHRLEVLYANWFCDRDINDARAQLLPKRGDGLQMDWSQLRLGYRMGMCSVLALWVCWDCYWGLTESGHSTIGGRAAFPVFRACCGLLLVEWFWGGSVWVWTRYRVNYIFIMDLDPNIVRSPISIFNDAVDDTLIYLVSMLLYYKAGVHDIPGAIPAGIFPALAVLYATYRLLFPLRLRVPMWKSIWEVVTSPMTSPAFFHSYIGDIFTSMVKVFQDLAWTSCFMLSGDFLIPEDSEASTIHEWSHTMWYAKVLIPCLTLAPLWIRFNQCLRRYTDTRKRFPHLANAFKYALSQTVTLFGAFHPLYMHNKGESTLFQVFWTFAFVSSSLYSFVWDVYMDWGLGSPKHGLLGPLLMYPNRNLYYTVIGLDLVLRFAWVLTLLPPDSGAAFALPAYLNAISMILELCRRTMWGFLRLENEHRSNAAGYRRVDFVPLHFSTGHAHDYRKGENHTGSSVLFEVAFITIIVVGSAAVSVVAAQHATLQQSREL